MAFDVGEKLRRSKAQVLKYLSDGIKVPFRLHRANE